MSREWSHGVFGCFGDCSTCKSLVIYIYIYSTGYPRLDTTCIIIDHFWSLVTILKPLIIIIFNEVERLHRLICQLNLRLFYLLIIYSYILLKMHYYNYIPVGLLSFFCPCYVIGKNAEAVGESCCLYCCLSFVPFINFWCSVAIRGRIRAQKGIDVSVNL